MTELPSRGDFVWLEFSPQAGREQAGRRPAIVLTPKMYHEHSVLSVVCPITTKSRGWPTEVALPHGLPVSGVVLVDQVRAVDRDARHMTIIGRAPLEVLEEVNRRLVPLLGL